LEKYNFLIMESNQNQNYIAPWASKMDVTHVVGEQDSNYVLAWREMTVRPHMFRIDFTLDSKKFYKAIEKEFKIEPENLVAKIELIYHADTDTVVKTFSHSIKINDQLFMAYVDTIMEPELIDAVDNGRTPARDIVDLTFYYYGPTQTERVEKLVKKLVNYRVDRTDDLDDNDESGVSSTGRKVGLI
jgi:hypothetical protein